MDKPNFRLFR